MQLAQSLNTEIISADSRQIYKYMNIGTAKPTGSEREQIKHHLIDIITPDQAYNAGRFATDTGQIIKTLHQQEKIPLLVGGTGFYFKSLAEGLFESSDIPWETREEFKLLLEEKGSEYLYSLLKEVDAVSAQRIHPNDVQRVRRALEVWKYTGAAISEHWEKQSQQTTFRVFNILVFQDRAILYPKINQRVDEMINNGLVEEIGMLLAMGYKWDNPGMNTVGYLELRQYFEQGSPLQDGVDKIKQNTRNYAKRQFTWYRKIKFDLVLDSEVINFLNVKEKIISFLNQKGG